MKLTRGTAETALADKYGPPVSLRYFPSMAGRSGVEGNEFIFTRDLPLGVMPIGGRREGYRALLEPPDDATASWLVELLDVGRFSRKDLSEALVDFVEMAVRYLAYSGEALFEIATMPDEANGGLRLLGLPPGRVIRTRWGYYQVVPKADRTEIGKGKAIRIPREKIWRITLPRHLGGARRHRRMLKALRERSTPTPNFVLKSQDIGRSAGYELSAHKRACDIGTERATRRWGTMPSFFRVEGTTEYFSFSRRLAWKRAQNEVRDHVIAELNGLLARLGVSHRIVVEGLTTPTEIAQMMGRLRAGDVTVGKALAVDKE
jgi:hypothetical protein